MHSRMFALLPKEEAKDSNKARQVVYDELSNDGSFVGEGGRFGTPLADWFVIGGRWSRELTDNTAKGKKLLKIVKQKSKEAGFDEIEGVYFGDTERENLKKKLLKEIDKLYQKELGLPFDRDNYSEFGYEDDAMILTKELYKNLLTEYEGIEGNGKSFVMLDNALLTKECIGKYWVVIVDCHN